MPDKLEHTNAILSFILTCIAMVGLFYFDAQHLINHTPISWWFNLGFFIPFGVFLISGFLTINIHNLFIKLFHQKNKNSTQRQSSLSREGADGYAALYKSGCFFLSIPTFFLIKLCVSLALNTTLFSAGFFILATLSLGFFIAYLILMDNFFLDKEIVYFLFKK